MDMRNRDNYLVHLMNNGFERAAQSFSKFIHRPVQIVNGRSIVLRHEEDFSYVSDEQGDLLVLVTQIIGDISGKSFLIFSKEECLEIFNALTTNLSNTSLNEAFLMEIDNIISASVIAELANALNLEIYGDVPQLTRLHSKDLSDFLRREANHDVQSSTIFCNTTFRFSKNEKVHPQFIWKLSSKVFDSIPQQRITA